MFGLLQMKRVMQKLKLVVGVVVLILIHLGVFLSIERTPIRMELLVNSDHREVKTRVRMECSEGGRLHLGLATPKYIADAPYARIKFELPRRELEGLRLHLGEAPGGFSIKLVKCFGRDSLYRSGQELSAALVTEGDTKLGLSDEGVVRVVNEKSVPVLSFSKAWLRDCNRIGKASVIWRGVVSWVLFGLVFYVWTLLVRMWRSRSLMSVEFLAFVGLLAGFVLAFASFHFLKLPFSNPWEITGLLTVKEYNPSNDVIRFLYFILLPGTCMFVFRLLGKWLLGVKEGEASERSLLRVSNYVSPFVLLGLLVVFLGNDYSFHQKVRPVDTFHEGETLGAATDYLHGLKPYKESLFVHGVFQDPIRSIAGFGLFGRAISSKRVMQSWLEIAVILMSAIAVFELSGRKWILFGPLFAFILMMRTQHYLWSSYFMGFRDGIMLLLLCLLLPLYAWFKRGCGLDTWRDRLLCYLWGLIPSVAFFVSIDRGFFVSVPTVLLWGAMLFVQGKRLLPSLKYFAGGAVTGLVVLVVSLRGALWAFIKFAFIEMPQFKELMDGVVYRFDKWDYSMPVIAAGLSMAWLALRLQKGWKPGVGILQNAREFIREHFVELFLVLLGICFFRSALGRSDFGHRIYASFNIVLAFGYIVFAHYFVPWAKGWKRHALGVSSLACVVLSLVALWLYWPRISWSQWFTFPTYQEDDRLLSRQFREVCDYLDAQLDEGELFYSMTNEGVFYHVLDRPCPTRFNLSWVAMPPFYQEELVDDLESAQVDWVIYKSDHWACRIDGFENEERLPIVTSYLQEHFEPHVTLHGNEIWRRKLSGK